MNLDFTTKIWQFIKEANETFEDINTLVDATRAHANESISKNGELLVKTCYKAMTPTHDISHSNEAITLDDLARAYVKFFFTAMPDMNSVSCDTLNDFIEEFSARSIGLYRALTYRNIPAEQFNEAYLNVITALHSVLAVRMFAKDVAQGNWKLSDDDEDQDNACGCHCDDCDCDCDEGCECDCDEEYTEDCAEEDCKTCTEWDCDYCPFDGCSKCGERDDDEYFFTECLGCETTLCFCLKCAKNAGEDELICPVCHAVQQAPHCE